MAEYSSDINIAIYKNRQPVYITETSGEDQEFIALKLSLNQSNFNFDLAREDGLDFRLAERSNGTGVLQMWIAYWDSISRRATLWFKLPQLLASETKTMYAFWGLDYDVGISDLRYLLGEPVEGPASTPVFLFGDDFNGNELDVNKWPTSTGSWTIGESKINLGTDAWINTGDVLNQNYPPSNFIVEDGVVGIGAPSSTTTAAHRYRFLGGENVFGIDYFWDGSTDRKHDAIEAGTYVIYNGDNKGLLEGEYNQTYIAYYEATDRIYQGMVNRSGHDDYEDSWERQVHRNTEVNNFRIYGEGASSANGVAIDWVVAREYNPAAEPSIDLTNLWVEYELIGHQQLDPIEYSSDITTVDFHHLSTMGGDPYRMSDDVADNPTNIFVGDEGTLSGSITIDFGRSRYSVTNDNYIHYNDTNTIEFYNASKLSDLQTDVHGRNYWQSTTTSGWAAIKFPSTKNIACLSLKAVPGQSAGMPDDFRFYGSQSNPRFGGWNDKVLIYQGNARDTEDEQIFYFSTGSTFYKYYILEILNTHGGNITIQEWGMYENSANIGKRSVSQLRLRPATFNNNEYYFTKQIELYGSNNGYEWDELIPLKDTPTPFIDYVYGRWSRYSFYNIKAYYLYKLVCYDNWRASEDIIKIAEWEMVERLDEAYNYRILDGTSENINNIWTDPGATINEGNVYLTNDILNVISNNKLIQSATISGSVADFNVKL